MEAAFQLESPDEYGGYVFAFDPDRTVAIAGSLRYAGDASATFTVPHDSLKRREIALLALDGTAPSIGGAVLVEKMRSTGGTATVTVRFVEPVLFDRPVPAGELENVLARRAFDVTHMPVRLEPERWNDLIRAVKRRRPESAEALDRLMGLRSETALPPEREHRRRILATQRDAIATALEIAGMDRKPFTRAIDPAREPGAHSALDLFNGAAIPEQARAQYTVETVSTDALFAREPNHEHHALRHDWKLLEKLLEGRPLRVGTYTKPKGGRLAVYIYDREHLETVTGVDLLLHNRAFNSFLLLQYKMMKRVGSSGWSYLVDEQLTMQLEAMRRFESGAHAGRRPPAAAIDWRMNPTGCYVKFCEAPSGPLRDDRLVPGLVLSAEHLDHFLTLPESAGAHGGHRIGYANCERYLNNTLFVDLAYNGWIGCDRAGFELLSDIITAGQQQGRTAMFAVVDSAIARGRR